MTKHHYSFGKITNFYSYTDDMLDSLRVSMELSIDLEALKLCRNACKKTALRDITVAQLRIIDEIFKSTPADASNASIAELLCSDQNLITTFNDLISKRSRLSRDKQTAPLTLTTAAEVCSEYLETVGIEKNTLPPTLKTPKGRVKRDELILSYLIQDATEDSPLCAIASRAHGERFEIHDSAFEQYYLPALKASLTSLLDALAYGYDRESLSLVFKYEFPKSADAKALGDCLSIILGAYRVACELCISDIPMVSFTDKENLSFEAEPLPRAEKAPLPSLFNSKGAKVYLLPFFEASEAIPSFERFRAACDLYHSLASTGKLRSARALVGKLSDTLKEMSGDAYLVPSANLEKIPDSNFFGVIFESFAYPDGAIWLGNVEQIEKTIVSEGAQNGELQQI